MMLGVAGSLPAARLSWKDGSGRRYPIPASERRSAGCEGEPVIISDQGAAGRLQIAIDGRRRRARAPSRWDRAQDRAGGGGQRLDVPDCALISMEEGISATTRGAGRDSRRVSSSSGSSSPKGYAEVYLVSAT